MNWTAFRQETGDFSLFLTFMARQEASSIIEGIEKSVKGSSYLKPRTISAMEDDLMAGMLRSMIIQRMSPEYGCSIILEDGFVSSALKDLKDWMDARGVEPSLEYFDFLSRWDLEGHDWCQERPEGFDEFIQDHPLDA